MLPPPLSKPFSSKIPHLSPEAPQLSPDTPQLSPEVLSFSPESLQLSPEEMLFSAVTAVVAVGKLWGDEDATPYRILMVHGIQDNCGSFDRLIPTLSGLYCILAVDLPSHGLSSHFPIGMPLDFTNNFILSLKRVLDYVRWQTCVYIGHSFGGQIGTYFAGIFPEHVQKLIILDTMCPKQLMLDETLSHLRKTLTFQLDLEEKLASGAPPVYTYERALAKLIKNRPSQLTEEAAAILIKRSICPAENDINGGYVFRSDQRLKYQPIPTFTFQQQIQIIGNISCPTLYILADQNMQRYDTYLKDMFAYISRKENCKITVVAGNHDVHQNHPERVNFLIDDFLLQQ